MKLLQTILNSVAVAVLSIGLSHADVYAKGSKVTPFQAKDQHGAEYAFEAKSTNFLLDSFDMETGKKANAALNAQGAAYLPSKKAVYVANIFGMPGIGRMFAMPKMKKYSHQIILADDAALIAKFPEQKGKVAVLAISGGKVTSIKYWTPGTEGVEAYLK